MTALQRKNNTRYGRSHHQRSSGERWHSEYGTAPRYGLEIVGDIVMPKRRLRPPRSLRLVSPATPDETPYSRVNDVNLTEGRRTHIVEKYKLHKLRSGKANSRERAIENRVRVYSMLESVLDAEPETAAQSGAMKFGFWLSMDDMNAEQIIAAIKEGGGYVG
jgi:hypothetical protein